jgi:hypothetical protein
MKTASGINFGSDVGGFPLPRPKAKTGEAATPTVQAVSVRLPPEVWEALDVHAKRMGRRQSVEAGIAIKVYLAMLGLLPKSEALPADAEAVVKHADKSK